MRIPDSYDTIIHLRFADPALADLQVAIRRSWGLVDSAGAMPEIDADAVRAGKPRPEDLDRLRRLVDDFAAALVSWNLEDDQGRPLGTDRDTVRGLDVLLVLQLVAAFFEALTQVADELRQMGDSAEVREADLQVRPQ